MIHNVNKLLDIGIISIDVAILRREWQSLLKNKGACPNFEPKEDAVYEGVNAGYPGYDGSPMCYRNSEISDLCEHCVKVVDAHKMFLRAKSSLRGKVGRFLANQEKENNNDCSRTN